MWALILWMLIGMYGLIENAELIAAVEDKKMKSLGMLLLVICTPIRIICGIFEYMLEQTLGEGFDGDDTGCCQ